MVTTLDRIISLIEHSMPLSWSNEAEHGLTLLQNHGIKFERVSEGVYHAWHKDTPTERYTAPNGLLAGCRCYLALKIKDLT